MTTTGIYIHVPFCASKCGYCSFYSAPAGAEEREAYAKKIQAALESAPFFYQQADTVYFGGGTPSLLGDRLIKDCLLAADKRYPFTEDCEITVEANPSSLSFEQLKNLKACGVNRLSMGVQSLEDSQLKMLGRQHSGQQALEMVDLAKQAGFENISVDLMLGLPGQNLTHIEHFVQEFSYRQVSHISAYILKIEEGTPFFEKRIEDICPDEDTTADMYLQAAALLEHYGYHQYEISNFAKEGKISRHNTRYWQCKEYLGLGPSAHSFAKGMRYYFPEDTKSFLAEKDPWSLLEEEGPGGDYEEFCMLGLRLNRGLCLEEVRQRYPAEDTDRLLRRAKPYIEREYMWYHNGILAFTSKGFLVSNDILATLLL